MASPRSTDNEQPEIDASEPFKGAIVCCTSIPPDHRTVIAQKVAELGGVHKYDLTPDVTHLVVGDYDTPKYRHVARERPDIKAMDAGWIDAVSELWKNDDELDFFALEKSYQLRPLETKGAEPVSQEEGSPAARGSLLICLTGFGDQRDDIAEKIAQNGGRYTGDLTRRCSHLIVNKPEGKKFTAAKSWGVRTVTLDWLNQSVERGLILEEAKFDPLLPPEEQGVGAWVKKNPKRGQLGKRSRSAVLNGDGAEEGTRKLRKTASMKLSSQRNNLWGDILGKSGSREYSFAHENRPDEPAQEEVPTQPSFSLAQDDQGLFSNCIFAIHGFPQQRAVILEQTIATRGGSVVPSLQDPAICSEPADPRVYRFLIVPQTSQPDTHPRVPHDSIHVITEFYIENCLHNKRFFSPNEQVLGRPFPLFPIPGFSNLTICSAAFTGIELNQVARSVAQLGGKFDEEFRRTTSVLVCKSLGSIRKDKLKCALGWGVPVVSGDWLWECISTGYLVPIEDYVYPELKKRRPKRDPFITADEDPASTPDQLANSNTRPAPRSPRSDVRAGVDTTAFDRNSPEKANGKRSGGSLLKGESITSADFTTARTQPRQSPLARTGHAAPLSETSSSALNKSSQIAAKPTAIGPARTISAPAKVSDTGKHLSVPDRAPSTPPLEPMKNLAPRQQQRPAMESGEGSLKEQEEATQVDEEAATETEAEAEAEAETEEKARQRAKAAEMRQDLTSALSGLIQPTAGLKALDAESRPRRRRQKILGRAISNISNASNASSAASVDSGRPVPESLRADDDAEEPAPPPATQLEYRDPEALESKAMLMSRMMGGSGEAKDLPLSTSSSSAATGFTGSRSLRRR